MRRKERESKKEMEIIKSTMENSLSDIKKKAK